MDDDDRERWINAEANALWEKLRFFPGPERLMILTRINIRVTRKLQTRESSQYHMGIDFTADEHPTDPAVPPMPRVPDLGARVTRAINREELDKLKRESKK